MKKIVLAIKGLMSIIFWAFMITAIYSIKILLWPVRALKKPANEISN